jgi:hypothetical protein
VKVLKSSARADFLAGNEALPSENTNLTPLAPFETEGGGNAAKTQDLWIGDTIRFPSPAPQLSMIRLPLRGQAIRFHR